MYRVHAESYNIYNVYNKPLFSKLKKCCMNSNSHKTNKTNHVFIDISFLLAIYT